MVHFQLGQYVKKHRLLTSLTLVRVFKGSKGFQGVPGVSKGFQGVPRGSKEFKGVFRGFYFRSGQLSDLHYLQVCLMTIY